jgi:predicted nucleotidyltransferase component of viral defense system
MLDRARHETILKNILREIYQHPQLQAQLAFKGGTCLYLFYDLPRFSIDLDFTLVADETDPPFDPEPLRGILTAAMTLAEDRQKQFTWFWIGRYAKGAQNVKVEISKRQYDDRFAIQDFLGVSIRTLDLPSMFAHKMCAISDRRAIANRDLFDTWWLLKKMAPIRSEIIQERTGKTLPEYLSFLRNYIPQNVDRRHIVDGLGELLSPPQKDWVRDHLLDELLAQLQIRLEAER